MARVTGEGSIVPREYAKPKKGAEQGGRRKLKPQSTCRVWQLRVPVGTDATGKYRQRTKTFHGTYTEAKAALREFIALVEADGVQARTDWTFEEYCAHYLEVRKAKGELAPSTERRQRHQMATVIHHLGKTRLERITTASLDGMYVAMMQGDTLSGRPNSGCYVGQVHQVVRQVFKLAVEEGVLVKSPAEAATPPKKDTKPCEVIPTARVVEMIGSFDLSDAHHCAYILALTMGLRRGEVCGLSWGDIDWEKRVLAVRHSYDDLGNLKEPKTKAGRRLLPIPDTAYESLRRRKKAQAEHFKRVNERRMKVPEERRRPLLHQSEESAVFVNDHGERLHPGGLESWWHVDRLLFGLPRYKFHGLRHTYLSMLAEQHVHPKVMQELAGHASINTTMEIYTHVNMDEKRDAAASLQGLLSTQEEAGEERPRLQLVAS